MGPGGLLTSVRGMGRAKPSIRRYLTRGLKASRCAALGFLLVALAAGLQGCADSARQSSKFPYGSASDYTAYGYNDPYAFGPYDPLLYSYWYPQPYYYYGNYPDVNDHDCDDGYCGPHRGHRLPSPIYPHPMVATRPLTPMRGSSSAGFAAQSVGGFHSGFHGDGGFASHGSAHR